MLQRNETRRRACWQVPGTALPAVEDPICQSAATVRRCSQRRSAGGDKARLALPGGPSTPRCLSRSKHGLLHGLCTRYLHAYRRPCISPDGLGFHLLNLPRLPQPLPKRLDVPGTRCKQPRPGHEACDSRYGMRLSAFSPPSGLHR